MATEDSFGRCWPLSDGCGAQPCSTRQLCGHFPNERALRCYRADSPLVPRPPDEACHDCAQRNISYGLLWMRSWSRRNAFEVLCSLLSALTVQQLEPHRSVVWRPMWKDQGPTWTSHGTYNHAAMISERFMSHTWRNGLIFAPASGPAQPANGTAGRVLRCSASGVKVSSSLELFEHAWSAEAHNAVRSFRRAVFRWWAVPPAVQPVATRGHRRAVLMVRLRSRGILNSDEVIRMLRSEGYSGAEALVVERVPLASLLSQLRGSELMVTLHGATMINQIFMPLRRSAVIEAFTPHFLYGTGFDLSRAAGHLHLPLLLEWDHADRSTLDADAARRSGKSFDSCSGVRPGGSLFHGKRHKCVALAMTASYRRVPAM